MLNHSHHPPFNFGNAGNGNVPPDFWNELLDRESLQDPYDVPHSTDRPPTDSALFKEEDDYWTDEEKT